MKIRNYLLLKAVLVAMLFSGIVFKGMAQNCTTPPGCLLNPNLTSGTAGPLNPNVVTMNDWYRSHGDPQINLGGGYSGSNALYMAGQGGGGDGAYACYNFKKNHTYKVCLWAKHDNTSSTNGSMVIKAANGLTEPVYPGSFNLPSPPSSQNIYVSGFSSSSWTLISTSFTPTADFSQLWIYPNSAVALPLRYKFYVSKVSVFEVPLPFGISTSCEGDIVLDGSSYGCATAEWYNPGGEFLGTGTIVIRDALPSMSGNYMLTLRNGDCAADVMVQVYVSECNCEDVVPDFEAQVPPNPVLFTETTTGPGISVGWYWDFDDGGTSNLQNPAHPFDEIGEYNVCLTIIRKVGDQTCCVNICKEVQVGMPPEDFIGSGNSNTDELENPFDAIKFQNKEVKVWETIAISKDFEDIKIIPNPASQQATVMGKNLTNATVDVYNMTGAHVATGRAVEKGQYLIQLPGLPSGMYVVKVKSGGSTHIMKLVKE